MSISFSGLGSGLDYSTWIDELVKIKKSAITTVENKNTALQQKATGIDSLKTAYMNLNSAVQKLTDAKFFNDNVFSKYKTSSSHNEYISATTDESASKQSINVDVKQLATSTTVHSLCPGKMNGDSLFKDLARDSFIDDSNDDEIVKVSFSVTTQSPTTSTQEISVEISEQDSMDDVVQKFRDNGLEAEVKDGKLSIATGSDDKTIEFKADEETDKFVSNMCLERSADLHSYQSSHERYTSNLNNNTKVATLGVSNGNLVFYVGGQKCLVEIEEGDNLAAVAGKIVSASGGKVEAGVNAEGKFYIKATPNHENLSLTSGGTSNFFSVMQLVAPVDGVTGEKSTSEYISNTTISSFDASKPLMSSESGFSGIKAGSFEIGNASFEITSSTTMNDLVTQINNSVDAGVSATFDSSTGKMTLTSKTTGELYVNVNAKDDVDGGSNFTDIIGMTQNRQMTKETQQQGNNAIVEINGKNVEYYSNVIPESVSGIAGVTLTANKVPPADFSDAMKIEITQDTEELTKAVEDVVNAYNKVLEETSKLTKVTYSESKGETTYSKGVLAFDNQITSMLSQVRNLVSGVTDVETGSTFKRLSQVGISTAAAGASLSDNTGKLEFDKEKFVEAFSTNPDQVKEFLIGDVDNNTSGFLGALSERLNSFLDFESGYFAVKAESLKSQMSANNDKIDRLEKSVEAYRSNLEKQFLAMDQAISNMNAQYQNISSILASINSGNAS